MPDIKVECFQDEDDQCIWQMTDENGVVWRKTVADVDEAREFTAEFTRVMGGTTLLFHEFQE